MNPDIWDLVKPYFTNAANGHSVHATVSWHPGGWSYPRTAGGALQAFNEPSIIGLRGELTEEREAMNLVISKNTVGPGPLFSRPKGTVTLSMAEFEEDSVTLDDPSAVPASAGSVGPDHTIWIFQFPDPGDWVQVWLRSTFLHLTPFSRDWENLVGRNLAGVVGTAGGSGSALLDGAAGGLGVIPAHATGIETELAEVRRLLDGIAQQIGGRRPATDQLMET